MKTVRGCWGWAIPIMWSFTHPFFLPCRVKITLLQHLGLLHNGCRSDTFHVPNHSTHTHTHDFNMPLSRDSKSFSSWLNPNNVLRVVPCLMEINISLEVLMRYKTQSFSSPAVHSAHGGLLTARTDWGALQTRRNYYWKNDMHCQSHAVRLHRKYKLYLNRGNTLALIFRA